MRLAAARTPVRTGAIGWLMLVMLGVFGLGLWAERATAQVSNGDLLLAAGGPRFLAKADGAPTGGGSRWRDVSNAAVFRQHISLELKGVPRGRALEEIAKKAGLRLTYSAATLSLASPITLSASELTVGAALSAVLFDAGVDILLTSPGQAALIARVAPEQPQVGAIVGRVTDKRTGTPLVGATVLVDGTPKSATAGNDGRYRIAELEPGTYTVRARLIGYTPLAATVSVTAEQEAVADFGLERSMQRLDEVVTTGTVVPTEVKALPVPISVITADQIEQRGYQRVDEIFRGDIPGATAWDPGAASPYTFINIRGGSSLSGTNVPKTYIDGVEVADPSYLGTIDPASIERIEVLRGPQGSTMYGSQALAGVIQIFTKKGQLNAAHPELEVKTSAGLIQSQWDNTHQQDHSLAVAGGGRNYSYRFGGGFVQHGDWVPNTGSKNANLSSGVRAVQGPLTADFSARFASKSFGDNYNPAFAAIGPGFASMDNPWVLKQQTYGLTLKYAASPRWQHTALLGFDRTGWDYYLRTPAYTTPADSFLYFQSVDLTKLSAAYNSTLQLALGRAVQSSLTAGVDYWTLQRGSYFASGIPRTTDPVNASVAGSVSRRQYDNAGAFVQGQLGFREAVFLTAGLRADHSPNFGSDYGLAWAPRVGASYVHTFGDINAKVRGAYGKAIRPPDPLQAQAITSASSTQLANPNLGPEQQAGVDAGLEIDFGGFGSLEVSYYDQTVTNLIDVARSSATTYQYQNVGRIKNTGWEFQGQVTTGRLSVGGTYSIAKSVVERLSPSYTGDLLPGDHMRAVPKHSAGATLSYGLPRTTMTFGLTYIGSYVSYDYWSVYTAFSNGTFTGSMRDYWVRYPSFAKLNLMVSQKVGRRFSTFLQVNNLTNNNTQEQGQAYLTPGRMTMIGVRVKN